MDDRKSRLDKIKHQLFRLLARQIHPPLKPLQVLFDLVVGIGLPVLALLMDGMIFKVNCSPHEILSLDSPPIGFSGTFASFRAAGYSFLGMGMIALAIYLPLRRDNGLLSGILTAVTTFCALLSSLLVPLSIVLVIMTFSATISDRGEWKVALCGPASVLIGFVYFRNAVRSYYGLAIQRISGRNRKTAMVIGLLMTLLIPVGAQLYIEAVYDEANELILSNDDTAFRQGIEDLSRYSILIPPTWMTRHYLSIDEAYRDRYAEAFRQVYDRDILDGIPDRYRNR